MGILAWRFTWRAVAVCAPLRGTPVPHRRQLRDRRCTELGGRRARLLRDRQLCGLLRLAAAARRNDGRILDSRLRYCHSRDGRSSWPASPPAALNLVPRPGGQTRITNTGGPSCAASASPCFSPPSRSPRCPGPPPPP